MGHPQQGTGCSLINIGDSRLSLSTEEFQDIYTYSFIGPILLNAEQENQQRTKIRGSGTKDAQNSSYRERVVSMSFIGKVASTLASQGPG